MRYFRVQNIILISFLLLTSLTFGQRASKEKGDKYFEKRMYLEAIQEYEKALQEKMVFDKFKMTKRIALTYKMLFDYEKADEWYAKLTEFRDEQENIHLFNHGLILCNLEKYEDAKLKFKSYFNLINDSSKYSYYEQMCDWAIKNKDRLGKVKISKTNIETGGRSLGLDFYENGIVYARPQSDEFKEKTVYYDLAYSIKRDTAVFDSAVSLAGDLSHSFYEGTPSFNTDGKVLYYSGNASEVTKFRTKKLAKKDIKLRKDGLNILHIYKSEKKDGRWSTGKSQSMNSVEFDCVFPFYDEEKQRLYYASNMEGGYGGYDLYYVKKETDSTWGKPVNLGEHINSELDEMYPYLDNDTLYYSSKGLKGFGGADIYKSFVGTNKFGEPKNMGKPYNSSKDDFSFVVNNEQRYGYFSSNREGNRGYDYIYEFITSEEPDTINGIAINKITENPIAELEVKLHRMNKKGVPELEQQFLTNTDGKVQLILDKHVEYLVTFYHAGFDSQTFEIPAENREDVVAKFGMLLFMPIPKKNDVIKIDNIYFDYNKSSIKEESFPVLDVIVEYLNKNNTIRVELSAHTDSRGSDSYNLNLSSRRAASVVKHLIGKGIAKSRLVPKGYGEKKLVNKCANRVKCTEQEHQENRRVELKVL
jgi:outer membrane protein OmpA-like peptidoglycan-associated protein